MRLHDLKPRPGARHRRKRLGQGEASGHGKTSGRGGKGQTARSGSSIRIGFEGGQMPLQRRLPKVGFRSAMKAARAEVRLHELALVDAAVIDLAALKRAGIVSAAAERAKVVLSGEIKKAVTLKGIQVTKGAREAIAAAGGNIED